LLVIPAEAGFSTAELVIQFLLVILTALNSGAVNPESNFFDGLRGNWIPALAGMTS